MEANLFRYIWRFSRREQIAILLLIVGSLPFYWGSLDIPKRIVNEAIQGRAFRDGKTEAQLFDFSIALPKFLGGWSIQITDGFLFEQVGYLLALSSMFLVLVLINGAFKYVINIRKGILGERMLRRLRFDLFAALMRFRPEDIRAVKPAEAAGMIKDEVEPVGGFIGEAFVTPAFLGTQALTAVLFILMQSVSLGLVAIFVVLIQAFVIPGLRREQIRLGRERQLASRHLAGRIGEMVESAPALHAHGTVEYSRAEVGARLGDIYFIRMALYRRKFAVKYLNNLLAQMTPFFFYAIGGYYALKGTLDIGQLIAVIAAYRDLPPPIKELIDWDQQRADVVVKYEQVVAQFSPVKLLPRRDPDAKPPAAGALLRVEGLRVVDGRGATQLESMSVEIAQPSHVALVGAAGSGRDVFARVLGRQISEFQGSVKFGDAPLTAMGSELTALFLGYAGGEASLSSGTIRDNILFALRRLRPAEAAPETMEELRRKVEAALSGNPVTAPDADWTDYAAAGVNGPAEIDDAILGTLRALDIQDDIYRLGLTGRLEGNFDAALARRFTEARGAIRERLERDRLTNLIEPFDPLRYNDYATIRENLLFGVTAGEKLAASKLISDPFTRSILEAESLIEPLTNIGLRIAEQTIEMFAGLPAGHAIFERYSFIRAPEMAEFQEIVNTVRTAAGAARLSTVRGLKLIALALSYVEPRHRLNLIDESLRERILRARRSFHRFLPAQYASAIEFYSTDGFLRASPIADNLLFGRIGYGMAKAEQKVFAVIREVLRELDLERSVYMLGLGYEAGAGGKLIPAPLRAGINLARCLIKRPTIMIADSALSAFGRAEAAAILERLRAAMAGRTLIVTLSERSDAVGFDTVLNFEGTRLASVERPEKSMIAERIGA